MDQYEEYYEEISDNEVEQQEEVVGVVASLPMEIPLKVQVAPAADNPQSPSLPLRLRRLRCHRLPKVRHWGMPRHSWVFTPMMTW